MKIIIVKKNTKQGERFYAYRRGILSFFGIYCIFNTITGWGERTKEECIEYAKEYFIPEPKPNKKIIGEVEI